MDALTCQMESVRPKIHEHMSSVGEDILCVLDRQHAVCCVTLAVRVFVLERLSAAARSMVSLFQREMETLETLLEKRYKVLDIDLHAAEVSSEHKTWRSSLIQEELQPPQIKEEQEEKSSILVQWEPQAPHIKEEQEEETEHHRESSTVSRETASKISSTPSEEQPEKDERRVLSDARWQPVVKLYPIGQQERSSSLVQGEPQPPLIKAGHKDLLQRPGEADESSGGDRDVCTEREPADDIPKQRTKTRADAEDCGASPPTSDNQLLSPHSSEHDTEDDDDWLETSEGRSNLNTQKSNKTLSFSSKLSQDLNSSKQTPSTRRHTAEKQFCCTECGKCFNGKVYLTRHIRRTHAREDPFTCKVCGKGCGKSSVLKVHMSTHTGGKPFICNVCGRGFKENGTLKVHMRTHAEEMPFKCHVCGKGCIHNTNLMWHLRTHTGEKPFTCELCGKGFCANDTLKIHMRTHTGEKPFSCDICGYRSSINSNLKKHMRTHTGEKPFTCHVCGIGCFDLKTHMRTHTGEKPFTCTVCGKGFARSDQLKSHLMIHTGETPYTCKVCKKGFAVKSNLKIHMRTHTGEKPFTCNICGKGFAQRSNRKAHMNTHNRKKAPNSPEKSCRGKTL